MIELLKKQHYNDMIPRWLPLEAENVWVAQKTGSVIALRADVGLVLSPRADFAIAVFCDQQQDFRESPENRAALASARGARLVWN